MEKIVKKLLIPAVLALMSSSVLAQDSCSVVIESNDQMKYNSSEITVDKAQCKEFTITLKHIGKLPKAAMGHNVVITKEADMNGVVTDGLKAGLAKDYLKENDERVIANTKMLGGGEEDSVVVNTEKLDAAESYKFFCSFAGHANMMNGKVVVK